MMPDTVDRYPINPLDGAAQFADELREIKRNIRELQGAPQVGSQFRGTDTTGATRSVQGDLGDGHYGLATYSPEGVELFRTDDRGIVTPSIQVPMSPFSSFDAATASVSSTSATFTTAWIGTVPSVLHEGVFGRLLCQSPAGTNGEIRVRALPNVANPAGPRSTSSQSMPGATVGVYADLRWLHGLVLPGEVVQFVVDIRRTAGAGSFTSYWPEGGLALAASDGTYVATGWV